MIRFGCSHLGHIIDLVHNLRQSYEQSVPTQVGANFSRAYWDSPPMAWNILEAIRKHLDDIVEIYNTSDLELPSEVRILLDSGRQTWPKLSGESQLCFHEKDRRLKPALPHRFQKQVHSRLLLRASQGIDEDMETFFKNKCAVLLAKSQHGHLDVLQTTSPEVHNSSSSGSDTGDSDSSSSSSSGNTSDTSSDDNANYSNFVDDGNWKLLLPEMQHLLQQVSFKDVFQLALQQGSHSAFTILKTVVSGWTTSRRFQTKGKLCPFCLRGADHLSHFIECSVAWQNVSRVLGHLELMFLILLPCWALNPSTLIS